MAKHSAIFPAPPTSDYPPFVELCRDLPSEVEAISPVVDQVMAFVAKLRNSDESELDIELALREALINAVVHGNHKDCNKRVYVTCRCSSDGEVSITVRDEGTGFEISEVPDPTLPANRLLTHGRGIYLMRSLMDEVLFEQRGAVVRMRKCASNGSSQGKTE